MKKKMPREFNRKLKREYQKGYAQRSLEARNILDTHISQMISKQVLDSVSAGIDVTINVSAKKLIGILYKI
jgi:Skp family chaperone for outer membrane proteins